jgi:hypothetical protein
MPKKVGNYTKEREEIVREIMNILEITDKNKMCSLKEIDDNEEKKRRIEELVPKIKEAFICSKWNYFMHKNRESKRRYLSLIRSVFKSMDIKIETVFKKKDGERETFIVVFF